MATGKACPYRSVTIAPREQRVASPLYSQSVGELTPVRTSGRRSMRSVTSRSIRLRISVRHNASELRRFDGCPQFPVCFSRSEQTLQACMSPALKGARILLLRDSDRGPQAFRRKDQVLTTTAVRMEFAA